MKWKERDRKKKLNKSQAHRRYMEMERIPSFSQFVGAS